jgi:hypothetical protein
MNGRIAGSRGITVAVAATALFASVQAVAAAEPSSGQSREASTAVHYASAYVKQDR